MRRLSRFPMKNENALRYLLLRHFQDFRTYVPRDRFLEVTKSLRVSCDRNVYTVAWASSGKQRRATYQRGDFSFYERGDTKPEARSFTDDLGNDNSRLARAFVGKALELRPLPRVASEETRESFDPILKCHVFEDLVFVILMATIGHTGYLNGGLLLLLLFSDYLKRSQLYVAGLFIVLGFLGLQGGVLLGAFVYAILQFMDPEPENRPLRIALSLGASLIAFLYGITGWGDEIYVEEVFLVLIIPAFVISFSRSLVSVHFRKMPLVLPFFCAGLALNHYTTAAVSGLLACALFTGIEFYIHKFFPVQSERLLNPNG